MKRFALAFTLISLVAGCTSSDECADLGSTCPALEQRVEQLLSEMTLEEKVAQMSGTTFISGLYGTEPWNVPGVERLGIPPFKMSDGPRGVGVQDGSTAFPVAIARGASWDRASSAEWARRRVASFRAIGHVFLGADDQQPAASELGTLSGNVRRRRAPFSRFAVASVQGLQKYVLANPKHFAANSIERTRFEVDVSLDERTLREIYLLLFPSGRARRWRGLDHERLQLRQRAICR